MKHYAAVDRHLMATETIETVINSLSDMADTHRKNSNDISRRLDNLAFVLSSAKDILGEFEENIDDEGVLIYNKKVI